MIEHYQITDTAHPQAGQIGRLKMIYYDHQHTGDSPDLLFLEMDTGDCARVLSTQVQASGQRQRRTMAIPRPALLHRADELCPKCKNGILRPNENILRCDHCSHEVAAPVDKMLRALGAPELPGLEVIE